MNNAYTCLNTHNVFLSASENKDSWKTVRENYKVTSDDPFNFYVHRASATDETAAPKGGDSIMVLVPCAGLTRVDSCVTEDLLTTDQKSHSIKIKSIFYKIHYS